MKPSTSCFGAICIALALYLGKTEPEIGWRIFMFLFFLGFVWLYGFCCRTEIAERRASSSEPEAK